MAPQARDKRLLPMGSCHGDRNKREILEHYKLVELFHGVSLDDSIHGCCQESSLTEFHRFNFQIREDKKARNLPNYGVMYVGSHCASKFRSLMIERGEGHKWPSLFNPLKSFNTTARGHEANTSNASPARPRVTVDAETILSLMMIAYPAIVEKPDSVMLEIFNKIRQYPRSPIWDSKVQSINTAIGGYLKRAGINKPFMEFVEERAAARGETLRAFDFSAFNAVLQNRGQSNNICG